eukprot:441533_1
MEPTKVKPPVPLTPSDAPDEEDNVNNENATVNTPSPSISRRYNYTEAMQYTFESPFNPIHSLSYAIRQHSTTNTITSTNTTINNTENNTQNENDYLYNLSLNEDKTHENIDNSN